MRVIVIPQDIDAKIELVYWPDWKANSDTEQLRIMQGVVGGYLEAVRCGELGDMYINEEGKLHGLRRNLFATHLAHECFAIHPKDFISGTAFMAGHDDEGNTVSVPDLTIEVFDQVYGVDLIGTKND